MKVEKLMTRDVRACRPEDDLRAPARTMWGGDCGCTPVVDTESRVVGMITDRDICMAAYTQGCRLQDIRVRDVMSRFVAACRASDELAKAEELMRKQRVRRLPVLDGANKLVGLISLGDIARAARPEAATSKDVRLQDVGLVLADVSEPRPRPALPRTLDPSLRKLSVEQAEIC